MIRSFLGCALAATILAFFLAGCASSAQQASQQASNIKPLAVLYGQYIAQHQGQPPPNEAEFKAFAKSQTGLLSQFQITDPESLFISTRDQKPYVVRYGAVSGPPGPGGQPVVAYEQAGSDGTRYVASSLGAVEEVDESKFHEYVPQAPQ